MSPKPSAYPHLARFSKSIGIPEANLVRAFEVERAFHQRILSEPDAAKRAALYRDVYETVHPLYGESGSATPEQLRAKDRIVRLFRRELEGRSILDVGCGQGAFLTCVARRLAHGRLAGIDVSALALPESRSDIRFVRGDVVRFDVGETFDVVFSDNVLEHIAPADVPAHLASVRGALRAGEGTFIVLMPSRLFGPCDVTRIIDYSYTNRIPAQGTHLNESTYTELMATLSGSGFGEFRTVCPLPKVKYILGDMRLAPGVLCRVEQSAWLVRGLHAARLGGRCIARMDVTLICRAL